MGARERTGTSGCQVSEAPGAFPAPGTALVTDKGLSGEDFEEFVTSDDLALVLVRPSRKTPQGFDLSNRVHPACLR